MKSREIIIILGALLIYGNAIAQKKYKTDTEDFLYWQPGVKVAYDDYKSDLTDRFSEISSIYDSWTISKFTIQAVLDLPVSTISYKGKEKAYFAPVFFKKLSYSRDNDQYEIKFDQLNFDLAEICSRLARKRIDSVLANNKGNSEILQYYFLRCTIEMREQLWTLLSKMYIDVKLIKRTGALERWEKMIAALLKQTEKYATQPVECHRFITGEPVEKNYVKAPTLFGSIADHEKALEFEKLDK